jgi:hypothetical protein
LNNGNRICAKHKRKEFMETKTPREVEIDPEKQKRMDNARKVAQEFVVPMRLEHILDKMRAEKLGEDDISIKDTKTVIHRMIMDIRAEELASIVWSKDVSKAIAREASQVFQAYLKREQEEATSE